VWGLALLEMPLRVYTQSQFAFGFRLTITFKVMLARGSHRAGPFGISSDGFKSKINIQKSPYDSSSYQSLAGLSPMLIIDWS
jgi:hypothetical protein